MQISVNFACSETAALPVLVVEWLMRILTSIVQPAACFLSAGITNYLHCGTIRPKFVRHNDMRLAVPFHGFPEELQRRLTIAAFIHRHRTHRHAS
jgi:hypothetical protein